MRARLVLVFFCDTSIKPRLDPLYPLPLYLRFTIFPSISLRRDKNVSTNERTSHYTSRHLDGIISPSRSVPGCRIWRVGITCLFAALQLWLLAEYLLYALRISHIASSAIGPFQEPPYDRLLRLWIVQTAKLAAAADQVGRFISTTTLHLK